jgi:hypothetical protein
MDKETELTTEKKADKQVGKWTEKINVLVAASTLLFAVCATLASFKAAGYGNQVVLAQNQASNLWAYYQAKSIKETLYKQQADVLTLAQGVLEKEKVEKLISSYKEEMVRYDKEQKDIFQQAKELEKKRDFAQDLNAGFGQALIFLQLGILLSSMAAISKFLYYWYAGVTLGLAGMVAFMMTFIKTL